MIDRQYGKLIFECDSCSETFEADTDDFAEAWAEAKRDGWKTLKVGIASDDAEARSLGWPCVGAQRMSIALAAARIKDFRIVIVPRGTTPTTPRDPR